MTDCYYANSLRFVVYFVTDPPITNAKTPAIFLALYLQASMGTRIVSEAKRDW